MTVGELKDFLREIPDEMEVLTGTNHGTLVRAMRIGTVTVIATRQNKNLLPGNEWRVPLNSFDEKQIERERHFVVT